jgi:hypothetical protein
MCPTLRALRRLLSAAPNRPNSQTCQARPCHPPPALTHPHPAGGCLEHRRRTGPIQSPKIPKMRCSIIHCPCRISSRSAWKLVWVSSLLFSPAWGADDIPHSEQQSVEGLQFRVEPTAVKLTWPSDPRESFAVLWRSNATAETPWVVLEHRLCASTTNQTTFCDARAQSRPAATLTNTPLADFYRVLAIPDFWFDMNGVTLQGGPPDGGEDFLPIYHGTRETGLFKPIIEFGVQDQAQPGQYGYEDIQWVNFGTLKRPRWAYAAGFWFSHDWFANGEHVLQLRSTFAMNLLVEGGQCFSFTNAPVRVRVSNPISFVGFQSLIQGDKTTFVAQSAEPQVNWRITVRDCKGKLLASKAGRTLTGNISWTWDLRDREGNLHDSLETEPYFMPTLTTWPLEDQVKGSQRLLEVRTASQRRNWWCQRLGCGFKRKRPTPEEHQERENSENPLQSQLQPRPWNSAIGSNTY